MRIFLVIAVILTFFSSASAAQSQADRLVFSRPTAIILPCENAPYWHVKVYEDDDHIFVYRHYGSGEYVPGVFVQNKKLDKWVEIKKLSTENAKLGQSPPLQEVRLSITWDHRYLSNMDYVDVRLKAGSTISFPDKISYDSRNEMYMIDFDSSFQRQETLTRFWISRKDLVEAFKKTR